MLRTNGREVESGSDRIGFFDFALVVLHVQGVGTEEDAFMTRLKGRTMHRRIHTETGRFYTDQSDRFFRDKVIEKTDGIGATTHASDDGIGQFFVKPPRAHARGFSLC